MADYEGMRWFKCDFQVQTPEDAAHWGDADTRLPEPRRPMVAPEPDAHGNVGPAKPDERRLQEVARAYLRRCHEAGLELIGVTDHNFSQKTDPRDWFMTHLVEQNKSVAKELGKQPLHILPGFEVDIGYHVLCLFEPAKKGSHVWRINRLLCKLGLDENERFRQGQPMPLRRNGANVSLKELIELVQEQHKGIVIAAHADQNDGLLNDPRNIEDYKNRKLQALEVTANPPARKILDIVEGRDKAWARADCHPAYVMSSDAKSLKRDENGEPVANSIGYRHTWLKMSRPSVEALRQAFLDPQSRIQLSGTRPSDALRHPRITGVSVKGAKFLADQELSFSEGLNCVIGGRGSGKSSLLEYMRFALNQDNAPGKDQDAALSRKRIQLKESLGEAAEIRIAFEAEGGVSDTLVYEPSRKDGSQRRIEGRDVSDLNTVTRQLQAQFFSQGELSRMTSGAQGQSQVLALIDVSSGPELIQLNADERELKGALKSLFQARRDESRLAHEISVAEQEVTELTRQLEARAALQGDSKRNQLALQARRFLASLQEQYKAEVAAVEVARQSLMTQEAPLPDSAGAWPNAEWFASKVAAHDQARAALIDGINSALVEFQRLVGDLLGPDSTGPVLAAIEADQAAFRAACTEKGIREEDIARLQELEEVRQGKLKLIADRNAALTKVKLEAAEFEPTLTALHAVWREQFEVRKRTADDIQSKVASNTVRLRTSFMNDLESFRQLWKRLAPRDGRSKLARRWEEIGDDLFGSWRTRNKEASPWETAEAGRTDGVVLPSFYGEMLDDLQPAMLKHLDSADVQPIWEDIRLTRVGDGIDVDLLRDDQSVAGSMTGALSEGQRNTVLLNLMLAKGEGPIVIDQPEDELDSSFIYKTLVTDLRSAKLKRQLIIATHNANLPVNADAELIYALEARDGHGQALAQGGLDRAHVADAVLDIMEGSEQAFKRRSEKYHF